MDNGHHGVLQGPSFPERIGPQHDPRSFFWCLWCVRGVSAPTPSVSLYSLFIVVSFFLNGVPKVGTCHISPFLHLLGVVVRTEKYDPCQAQGTECNNGSLSHRRFRFLRCPFLLQCFSCPVERYGVSLPVAGCLFYSRLYPCRGRFSPWTRRGFSLGWAPGPMQTSTWAYQSFTPHNTKLAFPILSKKKKNFFSYTYCSRLITLFLSVNVISKCN